jgi:phage-related protein
MAKPPSDVEPKPVRWVGSSREDLRGFPEEVRKRVGGALWDAQMGLKASYAKPLKGFGGASILEIVDDFRQRHLPRRLHRALCWRGLRATCIPEEVQARAMTPKAELELVEQRLKRAKGDYEQWSKNVKPTSR